VERLVRVRGSSVLDDTGKRPVEAVARVRQDMLPPAAQAADRNRYAAELLAAIDWALVPNEDSARNPWRSFAPCFPDLPAGLQDVTYRHREIRRPPLTAPRHLLPTGSDRPGYSQKSNGARQAYRPMPPS